MKSTKKYVSLIVVSVMWLVVFFGAIGYAEKFSIYWNSNHDYEIYNKIFQQFATKYGFEIEKTTMLWPEFKTKIMTDFAGGTAPDLIEAPPYWFLNFAQLGYMEDITEKVKSWPQSKDWFEAAWREVTLSGRIYGMKLHHTSMAFFYNKDYLMEAGLDPNIPPKTVREFQEACAKITKAINIPGYIFDADDQYEMSWMFTEETPYLIENDKIAINTPTNVKTLEILQDIIRNGWALTPGPGTGYQMMRRLFIQGGSAMKISGPWDVQNINKFNPGLNYGITIIPYPEGTGPRSLLCGTGIAICKGSRHAKEAWELMKMLTQVDIEIKATKEAGMLMPRKSWVEHPEIKGMGFPVADLAATLRYAVPATVDASILALPEISWGGKVWRKFYERIIYLAMPAKEAIQLYEEEANKLIQQRLTERK